MWFVKIFEEIDCVHVFLFDCAIFVWLRYLFVDYFAVVIFNFLEVVCAVVLAATHQLRLGVIFLRN